MDSKNSSKTYNAEEIAKYFLFKANESKKGISNKKLQKLLYYAQAWHLVFTKRILFKDSIKAWIHGPAIPSVYYKYKKFEFHDIEEKVNEDDLPKFTKETKDILDKVWDAYGKYDPDYLEILTHKETPWQNARENKQSYESSDKDISLIDMENYYSSLLAKKKEKYAI